MPRWSKELKALRQGQRRHRADGADAHHHPADQGSAAGNKALRQAIAAALDTSQIVQAVTDGLGTLNNSVVPSASAYYTAVQKQGFKHDPERAKQLLKEAGYKGEPIKMLANKRPIVPSFEAAVIAQAMLQAVGLNVEIEVLDWATQLDRYQQGQLPDPVLLLLGAARSGAELRGRHRPEGQAAAQGLGQPAGAGAAATSR